MAPEDDGDKQAVRSLQGPTFDLLRGARAQTQLLSTVSVVTNMKVRRNKEALSGPVMRSLAANDPSPRADSDVYRGWRWEEARRRPLSWVFGGGQKV